MNVIEEPAQGLILIQPRVFHDERGYFFELHNFNKFVEQISGKYRFVQDNLSRSKKYTLRGMHYQKNPHTQSKMVSCLNGSILDVVMDLRKDSKTYGQVFSFKLDAKNCRQLLVPKGFAHGFLALENNTVVSYKCDEYYHPQSDAGIHWNSIGFDWKIGETQALISEKDALHPKFSNQII